MADSLTVEDALKELRTIFPAPDYWIRITQCAFDEPAMNKGVVYSAAIDIDYLAEEFEGATLDEAMQKVRAWKESQDG